MDFSRSGGFAGLDERLHIDADGTATVTRKGRAGKPVQLTTTQLAALRKALSDPALDAPADAPADPRACADAFQYEIRTPSWRGSADDCNPGTPAMQKVLSALTPLLQATS
ncbi:hypothetical protein [Actinoplanes awajinensis]|uniref:Uncharacterized protein n=1 Tax=Actinoplanes awajinensis subsp. mycoplanecinus TaxID=135947 RepID=A0A0X3VAR0_9ACTN|nr:hypothetical protein [Actinoplanes awajinensis]KUL41342.1 hypothetical protein ADL15_03540 [Actinoplanes awajinensis subsp. mycoplanecinus]